MKNNVKSMSPVLFLTLFSAGTAVLAILSLVWGTADIPPEDVWDAFFRFDGDNINHHIILDLRVPRTLGDIAVGAAFAVSGAIMQGMTRNPLADSGILGINAGATFALSLCMAFLASANYSVVVFSSFTGALCTTLIVYGLTSLHHGKQSPVRLALAGTATAAFFSALSQAVALHYNVGQEVTFWTAGGVAGIRMNQLALAVPFIAIALVGSIFISPSLSILSVGEDAAKGLGIRIGRIKLVCMMLVFLLAGASASLAGPIAFVGLIVPHITRGAVGPDYRKIVPCSMVLGCFSMLLADLVSRMINPPNETPVGLIFAVLGVPFFLYLTRTGRRGLGA